MFSADQKWIMDKDFEGLSVINLYHKQNAAPKQAAHIENIKNRHMLIRKKFTVGQSFKKACIYITADDYYKLYINGSYIGQGPAPAYHSHYNMNKYDISGALLQGENIIAVHVYYQGLVNRVWNSGDYRMGMTAQIVIDDQTALVTDKSWKYENAREFAGKKTIGYNTQFVEDIDNRNKILDWKLFDFNDDTWPCVAVNENFDYHFFMQTTPSLQVYDVSPKCVREVSQKKYIIDFGHEITGRLLVSAQGISGDIVELRYSEELETPDIVKSNMRCDCDYNEKWFLSGENDRLEQYDYKAFRYAEIYSQNANIDIASVRAEVRHYPFDDKAIVFESSNPLLDKIWDICKNGVKYGTQEGFLDCPSREKGQYLGDATITSQTFSYLTGDYRMFKKCLNDFALSSSVCPGLMATAPGSWMQEISDFSLQWPLQLLKYYMFSGDIDFLKEMLPVSEGIINYFKKFSRADGLVENFNDKPIMVDWPANLRDGYDYHLMPKYQDGCNTVLNAFYIGAVKTVNKIKDILEVQYNKNEVQLLKDAFIRAFIDESGKLFVDAEGSKHSSLHANAISLFYGLVPEESRDIVNFIKNKRLNCGVYFSYFVMKALISAGQHDYVFELLTSEDKHSWGNMIKEGATTCFEAWGKEQKWNTSLCHPWASSPIIILIEDIIGVKIAEPGWKKVNFDAKHQKALEFLKVQIPTLNGKICVQWKDGQSSYEII